jgi:hypothetical protein
MCPHHSRVEGVVLVVKAVAAQVGILNMTRTMVAQPCSSGSAARSRGRVLGTADSSLPQYVRLLWEATPGAAAPKHSASAAVALNRLRHHSKNNQQERAASTVHKQLHLPCSRSFWLACSGPTTGACICSTGRLYITFRAAAAATNTCVQSNQGHTLASSNH